MRICQIAIFMCLIILIMAFNNAHDALNAAEQSSLPRLINDMNDTNFQGLPVKVKVKIFLQGCYDTNTGQMTTLLNTGGYLPLTSPHCENQRTVSTIPMGVTDWVLVQLHNTADGAPVSSHCAFLRQDGYIVADDGTTTILMDADPGNYFITATHRNHLTIMSASAIPLNLETSSLYDLTGPNKGSGISGMTELESGIWGMWAGDVNHDGIITTRDYVNWFESYRLGASSYQQSDINSDTVVDLNDYLIWLNNVRLGAASAVHLDWCFQSISVSKDTLDFGTVFFQDSIKQELQIINSGTLQATIGNINTNKTYFSIVGGTSFTIPPGSLKNITVLFTPNHMSKFSGSLNIYNEFNNIIANVKLVATTDTMITDIDGNRYDTVKLGKKWWTANNLKVTHYRNGDSISKITDDSAWANSTSGGWCSYDNDDTNIARYGRLYNWHTVNDSRGIAPEGWHIPTDEEWLAAVQVLSGDDGTMQRDSNVHWTSHVGLMDGESFFLPKPGGIRNEVGIFEGKDEYSTFWSSSIHSSESSWGWYFSKNSSDIYHDFFPANNGFAIRLIKD